MLTLQSCVDVLEDLYPLELSESWDHPGLIVGDVHASVRRIVCASDPTLAVVQQAIKDGADVIITHHPLFFRSVHSVSNQSVHGEIVRLLYEHHCALWVGHTNADAAYRGVAHAAADAFGLKDLQPLVPAASNSSLGLGRVGHLPSAMSLASFARLVACKLPATELGVQISGDLHASVNRVAILPGSGDSLFDDVRLSQVDVYVTSDLRHHPATDAMEQARYEYQLRQYAHGEPDHVSDDSIRPMLINTPHSAIESLWFTYAVDDITAAIVDRYGEHVSVTWIKKACDPWNAVMNACDFA